MGVVRNLIVRIGGDVTPMTAELKKAEKALAASKKEMNSQLDSLKGTFKTIGIGALAVGGSLFAMADKASKNAGELQKLSDVTGLTAERIQELKYVGTQIDLEFETLLSAQTKLTRGMAEAADGNERQAETFKKLGIAVQEPNGQMRDAKIVMFEVIDALGKMENDTQRDAYALKIFGKSALELNPLIKAGSKEIAKLSEAARKNGAVLSNEAVKSLDDYGDAMEGLKMTFEGVVGKLAIKFTPALKDLADKISKTDFTPIINGFEWVINNAEPIAYAIGTVTTAVLTVKAALFIESAVTAFKASMAATTLAANGTTGSLWALNLSIAPLLAIGVITIGVTLWGVNEAKKAVDELKGALDNLGNVRDKVSQELQKAYKDRAELKKKGIDTSKPSAGYAQGIDAYIAALEKAFQATNASDIKAPQWDWFALPKMIGSAFVDTPKYASGGVAYKPHLAVVGDNLNARNDPEIISPVSQIESILNKILPNQNSTTVLEIDGVQFGKIVQSTGQRFYKIQGNPRLT